MLTAAPDYGISTNAARDASWRPEHSLHPPFRRSQCRNRAQPPHSPGHQMRPRATRRASQPGMSQPQTMSWSRNTWPSCPAGFLVDPSRPAELQSVKRASRSDCTSWLTATTPGRAGSACQPEAWQLCPNLMGGHNSLGSVTGTSSPHECCAPPREKETGNSIDRLVRPGGVAALFRAAPIRLGRRGFGGFRATPAHRVRRRAEEAASGGRAEPHGLVRRRALQQGAVEQSRARDQGTQP